MFEKIQNCPICGGTKFRNQIICQDTLVSNESFVLTDCETCGLRITNPRPDEPSIGKYYESDHYNPHTGESSGWFNLLYKTARSLNLTWKKNLVNSLSPQGRLLDYGTGTGEFLLKMKSNGWKVDGLEPSKKAREFARQKYGLQIHENDKQLPDTQSFKVITLWHVLEHLHNINEKITTLKTKLSKEGLLFIAVPNYSSYDGQKYQHHWAGYDVPRHLTHFTPKTMQKFLKANGLVLRKAVPMKMDAYYVSILSEKNLNTRGAFLKGILTAFKSNSWAAKNSNNYSSLVYIAHK